MAAVIRIQIESSGGLDRVRTDIQGVGNTARKAGEGFSALREVGVGALRRVGEAAVDLAGGALMGIAGGFAGLVKEGLGFNNTMEQTIAKLNAFTKDGAVSAGILEDIKKEAALTPFAFEDMATATAALMPVSKASGAALMDLVKQAEILAASNPSEGLEGAAFALKEAVGGDFTSIIERFNLPRQYINELKAQGVPALEAVGMAMGQMGLDMDLVTNMAGTAEGRWSTFKDTITNLSATVTKPIFDIFSQGLSGVNDLITANQPTIDALATSFAQGVGSAITWLTSTALPALVTAWTNLQPTIATVSGFITTTVIPAISDIATWLQTNLPVAIGTTSTFWTGTLQPALQTVWTVLTTQVAPIISDLAATVLPILGSALQVAAGFWTNVLQPALNLVWGVLTTLILPILGDLAAWLRDNLPPTVQVLADFLTGTLYPAINTIFTFLSANLIPILGDVVTWLRDNVPVAIQKLTDFWTGTLKPALDTIWSFVKDNVIPILTTLAETVLKDVKTKAEALSTFWTGTLKPALAGAQTVIQSVAGWFGDISDAISGVIDWVGDLAEKLGSIEIPDWLEGHSPPPMADWLGYIGDAVELLVVQIGELAEGFSDSFMDRAKKFVDVLSPMISVVKSGIEIFTDFPSVTRLSGLALQQLMDNFALVMIQFGELAEGEMFSDTFLGQSERLAKVLGPVFSVIKSGLELFAEFPAVTRIAGSTLQPLMDNLALLTIQFGELAEGFGGRFLTQIESAADAIGQVIGLVDDVLPMMEELRGYTSAWAGIQSLVGDVAYVTTALPGAASGGGGGAQMYNNQRTSNITINQNYNGGTPPAGYNAALTRSLAGV